MRGRPALTPAAAFCQGLIPAGAGQTTRSGKVRWVARAHPRGCGADLSRVARVSGRPGSSPRVRGRRVATSDQVALRGLIPAGAGQTSSQTLPASDIRAHPRGCGADPVCVRPGAVGDGSSPRVRGRLLQRVVDEAEDGLIPAGAGQTPPPTPRPSTCAAHPRGCGADAGELVTDTLNQGSSPRVRGRRVPQSMPFSCSWLIPAGAGQTVTIQAFRSRKSAHPRGCGADVISDVKDIRQQGSSPRVRGRLRLGSSQRVRVRLIPAGAGQTHGAPYS